MKNKQKQAVSDKNAVVKRHRYHATAALIKHSDFGPIYNVSSSTVRRLQKTDPRFPAPFQIGGAPNSPWLFRRAETDAYFGVTTAQTA